MGYKKRGFGAKKYTGFGGKIEPGEEIRSAARRELHEECGIQIPLDALKYRARLRFLFPHKASWSQEVHLFLACSGGQAARESDEMIPSWFDVKHIPYMAMWQDGAFWLPLVLAGHRFKADFTFLPDNESLSEVIIGDFDTR